MVIQKLELKNFRNIKELALSFDPNKKVTAIIGENAQGKTNLLESIYFLAITRSFRTKRFTETIMWGREHGRIKGQIHSEDEECELEIAFTSQKRKKFKKEKVTVESRKYLRNLNVVLFIPEDIHIATGDPETRRRYLNLTAIQAFPGFLETLVTYTRALKNRNELLKINAPRDQIAIWDEKLAELGVDIWNKRKQLLDFFTERLTGKYKELAGSKQEVAIQYKSPPQSKEQYLEELELSYQKDITKRTTHFGPHRDNFIVSIDGEPIKKYGSRGECRTAVLALKLIELEFLREFTGEKPVLLLDDVLSELDHERQEHLIKIILEHQTILTTTCREHLRGFADEIKVLTMKEGKIEK